MDVVLELFDTFLLDRVYANVLPRNPAASAFDPVSTIAASLSSGGFFNGSWDTATKASSGPFARSQWQYEPASQYFSVQPGEYAYLSRWDRDYMYRQALSLYVITA